VLKYTAKEKQKEGLPKGARAFAVWLSKANAEPDLYRDLRISAFPKWLTQDKKFIIGLARDGTWPKRLEGGGWIQGSVRYKSPYLRYKPFQKIERKSGP
jgi:hypothetical protein